MPPSYETPDYWNHRFTREPQAFEWLLSGPHLLNLLDKELSQLPPDPEILHIGCGTSELAWHIRTLVTRPDQICNVDFAQSAIDAGRRKEDRAPGLATEDCMRWERVDLLSRGSLQTTFPPSQPSSRFDLVFDKATSDSIACGDDIPTPLPFGPPASTSAAPTLVAHLHPLHLLAIHLAALTTPLTGRWLCISYTADRFPFFAPLPASERDGLLTPRVLEAGLPHPAELWRLEAKWKIDAPEQAGGGGQGPGGTVHRPEMAYWVYVLVRTGREMCL